MEKQENLGKFILVVVVVGLTLVLGIYIAATLASTFDNSTLASGSVANESGFINQTGYTLARYSTNNFTLGAVTILNATDNTTIGAGNYTITAGVLRNATATNWASAKITYAYSTGYPNSDEAANVSNDLVDSLSSGTGWITIIIVVGFAVIVLGMLSEGLGKAARGSSAPAY